MSFSPQRPSRRPQALALPLLAGVLLLLLISGLFAATDTDYTRHRNRLLASVIRHQVSQHYSAKAIDDNLSRDAFQLYIKQLDSQKRFLLDDDVRTLRRFEEKIDDEVLSGDFVLVQRAEQLFGQGIAQAERMVREILAQPFDFSVAEDYETDPDKLLYCRSELELKERWRRDLKFRVLTRYLAIIEEQQYPNPAAVPRDKRIQYEQQARDKVLKQHNDYFTRLRQDTAQDQYDRYLNAFARAFDPHTGYLPPQSKEDFDISMRGSLEGIGATLRDDEGFIKVVKVIPGSPAARQGQLQADDIIAAVAQGGGEPVDLTDMRLRDAVALIRGKKGSEVRLTVRRAGHKALVIPIIRDVVVIEDSFVKSAVLSDPPSGRRYGYIKIPSFYRDFEEHRSGAAARNSTDDVRAALAQLNRQGIVGLILDLRNNGGGALTDAVGIAGLFIEQGPIVQVRSSGGASRVLEDSDPSIAYRGPLVVMVNQFSASASEIVAGALQDYRRAVIIGSEHTHGKGTVQVIVNLDDSVPLANMNRYLPLGAMRLTTQKFYRVSGESTQYRGVVADITLPDRQQFNKFGERYLDFSLPWDTIPSVKYRSWSPAVADLERLRAQSRERVARSADFAKISQVAQTLKGRMENTRQSLNLDTVYKERQELGSEMGGSSPHGDMSGDEDGKNTAARGNESEHQRMLRVLGSDPYALEARTILFALIDTPAGVLTLR